MGWILCYRDEKKNNNQNSKVLNVNNQMQCYEIHSSYTKQDKLVRNPVLYYKLEPGCMNMYFQML